ncbi:MAG: PAS domain-containing protein, partial [Limnospira sp. PMC 1286.21]|uniref:PAS domain-containing protein n=1 Tax=Limnospira sp. PMC 1286.21 TaxID=2981069 RepID=UPI0028E165AD
FMMDNLAGLSRCDDIAELAQVGIWVFDKNGITSHANSSMAEMLGIPTEHIIGAAFTQFLDQDWRPKAS